MQACRITSSGMFVEDVLGATEEEIYEDPLLVLGPAPDGFYHPCWVFTTEKWVEGDPDAASKRLEKAVAEKKAALKQTMHELVAVGYTCANGIHMQAHQQDAASLDDGVRLAQRTGAVTIEVRDMINVRHTLPVDDADAMVTEMASNWYGIWQRKNAREEAVDALVARTKLAVDDPNYLTVDQAITEIGLLAW